MKYLALRKFCACVCLLILSKATRSLAHVNVKHLNIQHFSSTATIHISAQHIYIYKHIIGTRASFESFLVVQSLIEMYPLYSIYRLFPAILGIQSPTAGATSRSHPVLIDIPNAMQRNV